VAEAWLEAEKQPSLDALPRAVTPADMLSPRFPLGGLPSAVSGRSTGANEMGRARAQQRAAVRVRLNLDH
jgi:hypothetical protein